MEGPNTDTSSRVTPDNYQPRSCAVCGNSLAPFGCGPPLTRRLYLWACGEHRAEVERQFTTGVEQPRQLALF